MIIRIMPHYEGGWAYDIWVKAEEPEDIEDIDPDDGGIHTAEDQEGALTSAYNMAQDLIKTPTP